MATNRVVAFPSTKSSFYPWMIVSCGMMFYCYNYFLRSSPSVMKNELTQAFHINALQFGLLTSCYYLAYVLMQVPAGMIYDKFGARVVLCAASLVALGGLCIFISADNIWMAGFGRMIFGLGSAFSYIGTLKLASNWLPVNRFATAASVTTAIGMISATMTQKYLPRFVEAVGYQAALRPAMIAGLVLSALLLIFVRNRPKSTNLADIEMKTPINFSQLVSELLVIMTKPQMWLIGAIGCLLYLPSSVFLDVWGIPYLKTVYPTLSTEQSAMISNCVYYGWIISCPLVGMLSDKIRRRRSPLIILGFCATLLLSLVFYVHDLSVGSLYAIFFLTGFCCGAHPLCFALSKESNSIDISGTAVAFTNMLIMLGGLIFQPVVGLLLDLHCSSAMGADGLRIYTSNDYTFALSIIPIGLAVGIVLAFFVKETYCQMQVGSVARVKPIAKGADGSLEPVLETE